VQQSFNTRSTIV